MGSLLLACNHLPPAPDYRPVQYFHKEQKAAEYKISDPLLLRFKATGNVYPAEQIDGYLCFSPDDIAASRVWLQQLQEYHKNYCKP